MSDKAIFFDRDDTLIEDPGYISSPEQVKLLDGVPRALVELKALGYKLVVVTNQSAVARGIVTEKVLAEIHERLEQLLAEKNAFLDGIYYCPYHPEGAVKKYRRNSDLRKPNPGMLLKAAEEMDLDLEQSWCVGNSGSDIEAGMRAGCKTILMDLPSRQLQLKPGEPRPDYKAVNIKEVVNIVKKYHRSLTEAREAAEPEAEPETEAIEQEPENIIEEAESFTETANQESQAPEQKTQRAQQEIHIAEPVLPDSEPFERNNEPCVQGVEEMPEAGEPVSPVEESQDEIMPKEPRADPAEQDVAGDRTERLLADIMTQLKTMQRTDMFGEFSIMRLIAGVIQIVVLFCLLLGIWFLISPNKQQDSVFISLGFAMVLQVMALTFYIMHGRR
jgi:D,D-heptose 1,7-bisphosphate phosphatase